MSIVVCFLDFSFLDNSVTNDKTNEILPPNTNHLYLFSAIAQSLAAILALTFTITLIVAQISSRYSHHILREFITKWTLIYFGFFIITIILSFWLLTREFSIVWLKISLILSSGCLLFLIPYIEAYRKKLNPEWLIKEQETKAIETWKANLEETPKELKIIMNFVYSAYNANDYDTFEQGLKSLLAVPINSLEKYQNDANKIYVEQIISPVNDVLSLSIHDPRAPFIVIDVLQDSLIEASNKKKDFLVPFIGNVMQKGGTKAGENDNEELVKWISKCFKTCTMLVLSNNQNSSALVLTNQMFQLAQVFIHKEKHIVEEHIYAFFILDAFSEIGGKAYENNNYDVLQACLSFLDTACARLFTVTNYRTNVRTYIMNLISLMQLCIENHKFDKIDIDLLKRVKEYLTVHTLEEDQLKQVIPDLIRIGSELNSLKKNAMRDQVMGITRQLASHIPTTIIKNVYDKAEDVSQKNKLKAYIDGYDPNIIKES